MKHKNLLIALMMFVLSFGFSAVKTDIQKPINEKDIVVEDPTAKVDNPSEDEENIVSTSNEDENCTEETKQVSINDEDQPKQDDTDVVIIEKKS